MIRFAIAFCVMGLFVYLLGLYEIAGVSAKIGTILLIIFSAFSLISFIAAITTGNSQDRMET